MRERPSQYAGTETRRQQIIQAALACFAEAGVAATTMADVRRRSGASHGSIYHHFHSKEQLAATVYLEGIVEYQSGFLAELDRHSGAKAGVFAMVRYHLGWVKEHPDWARYLFQMRHAEFVAANEQSLAEQNRAWGEQLAKWFVHHIEREAIRRLPRELYIALILGPCQELARLWLAGLASSDLVTTADEIAASAWEALRVKRARRPKQAPQKAATKIGTKRQQRGETAKERKRPRSHP